MTPPPTKGAQHHRKPGLMHQHILAFKSLTSHLLGDFREIVPVHMHALRLPIPQPVVVARRAFLDVAPCIAPIVDGVDDVGDHEIVVAQLVCTLEVDEVLGRGVPAGVRFLEKVFVSAVGLFVGQGFVLPFWVLRLQSFVLLQHPLHLIRNRMLGVGKVLFEPVVKDHKALLVTGEPYGVLGWNWEADDGTPVNMHHRSREGDKV